MNQRSRFRVSLTGIMYSFYKLVLSPVLHAGAGMTGGLAWVYDDKAAFIEKGIYHPEFLLAEQGSAVPNESAAPKIKDQPRVRPVVSGLFDQNMKKP